LVGNGRIVGPRNGTFAILRSHLDAELAPTCFHAQQAVEKALKALLTINQVDFRRTHDLEELATLVADVGLALPCAAREFRRLNPFAVDFRYDDKAIALMRAPGSYRDHRRISRRPALAG